MILSHWTPYFQSKYGDVLPRDYLAYDTETSGFSREHDLILEWGHVMVRDCKPVDSMSVLINWYAAPDSVPAEYLDNQINRVAEAMSLRGRPWHITPELLKTQGLPPAKVIPWIHELLCTCRDQNLVLAGHNATNFDNEMLVAHFEKDLGVQFVFPPNGVFDTGSVAKAEQLIGDPEAAPQPGEALGAYFRRIAYLVRPGVKWSLDEYCVKAYGLDKMASVDTAQMHAAGKDAFVVHLMVEALRARLRTMPVVSKTVPPDAATAFRNPKPAAAATRPMRAPRAPRPPSTPEPKDPVTPTAAELSEGVSQRKALEDHFGASLAGAGQVRYRGQRNR